MREFNTLGPVYPALHYHVNRVAVKAGLRALIEKGRYITLNAGRQTGKTTLFREVIEELEASSDYFGILLDFESLSAFNEENFYEELSWLLNEWRETTQPAAPEPQPMRHHGDFVRWLQATAQALNKKGLLIIDEFDAIRASIIEPLLSLFRGMYLKKNEPKVNTIYSIILVGVRNVPALLGGTQSPFNIAEQFTLPYFTPDEVTALFADYTAETGQHVDAEVIAGMISETEGQPFLVNRLGQILTQDVVPEPSQPITLADLNYALARLVSENNSHFYSMLSKATPHRQRLLPMLFYNQSRTDFLDDVTKELIMYGVLRVVEDEKSLRYARIGNPLYRKMLLLRFAPPSEPLPVNGGVVHRYVIDGLKNPLLAEQSETFELTVDEKVLRIYLVGIEV